MALSDTLKGGVSKAKFDWSSLISPALGALSSIGTGIFNSISSSRAQKKAYKYALDLQNRQNSWMEYMSNTAHQREVTDLRAAGLNPILSATGGSGASTPQAGSASMSPVDERLGEIISTALDYKRLRNETKQANSNVNVMTAQKEKLDEEKRGQKQANDVYENYGQKNAEIDYQNKVLQGEDILNQIANRNITTAAMVKKMASETKYTNERSRGYSESESQEFGGNIGVSRPNSDSKTKKRGYSVNFGGKYATSHSRTY